MTKDDDKRVCVQPAPDHRSFPDAADGRPMPPMGDELMTAVLNCDDARFVAIQLAQNGLTLAPAAQPYEFSEIPDTPEQRALLASINSQAPDDLVVIDDPDAQGGAEVERLRAQLSEMSAQYTRACQIVDKTCAERDALKAENERLIRLIRLAHPVMRECGWQLAPACAAEGSDGILEAACAEIEEEFGAALRAHEQGDG